MSDLVIKYIYCCQNSEYYVCENVDLSKFNEKEMKFLVENNNYGIIDEDDETQISSYEHVLTTALLPYKKIKIPSCDYYNYTKYKYFITIVVC